MASSKFELLRSACESVENSEKVLAIAYSNRKKFLSKNDTQIIAQENSPEDQNAEGAKEHVKVSDAIVSQSKAVWWDMLIKDLTETMHRKSREIVTIYEDTDASFKAENDFCAGNLATTTGQEGEEEADVPNVWNNFYDKLGEIDVSIKVCFYVTNA